MASNEKTLLNALAEKFNNLGLSVEGKTLYWHDSYRKNPACLKARINEDDKGNYEKNAQDIATTLRVLGIVTGDPELSHFQPYGPMWGMQEPSWDIIIPLSLIDPDKLDMWQTGPAEKVAKMRANARVLGS